MKTVKIFTMTLIVLLLVSTLFAAGQQEAEATEDIVLQYWSWDPELKTRNEGMIEKFEAANPNITIEMTTIEPKEYWTKIRIMASQKNLPDIFNLSAGYLEEWAQNGLLLDLGSFIENDLDKSQFYMNLFDAVKDLSGTDSYYAFPYALVTTCMYFNKDLFDEAGIAYPDSEWTWADFRDAAIKLTKDLNNDGSIDQWGYWFYGRYAHIESWVYANDGYLINRDTMTYAPDKNALEAIAFLTDLVLKDNAAPSKKEMSAFRQQDVFPQGAAAMFVDGSWNIDNNRNVAGDSINWGIAELPKGPNGDGSLTYGWPDSLAIAPTTKHAEAAWEFTKFAAGEGLTMDMVMAGKIPSYKPLTESADFLEAGQQPSNKDLLIKQAAEEMRTSFTLSWGEWRGYGAAESLGFNGIIDGIIDRELSYDEALEIAEENVNIVLNRNYK
jgi:multiple sugar transport system substrate-binding protein